ncbi:MAG TPA: hypothetical protein VMW17_21070 [Candidatus Binatia bacterium]|nr:hypothetical protein [Candidatus Binatia bacterium]
MNCTNFVANGARWRHLGPPVLTRGPAESFDAGVVGDPCIVWDPDIRNWRMFYFAARGQFTAVGTAMAVARTPKHIDSGDWIKVGRVPMLGPHSELCHKFWVLMDPQAPGQAVRIDDEYVAFFTTLHDGAKMIGRARARHLGGPWQADAEPVIRNGAEDAFDGRGADAVTAYWFEDRKKILLYYMAYPAKPQRDQLLSPLGPCQAAAVLDPPATHAEKLGPVLRPGSAAKHWCNGWIGGMQLLPAGNSQWIALINGSATPVREGHGEPDPSVAGWARSEEAFPVGGWRFDLKQSPIELPAALPPAARQNGEGVNFWRHYLLVFPDERVRIYYNSGTYGQEQLYARVWQP